MNSPRRIKVGLVQMQCTGDGQRNLDRAIELTREAAAQGANVVCLPELFRSLYFCQSEDYVHFGLAETIPGPTTQVFQSLAKELGIVVLVSVFEKRAEGLYHNTLTVIDQHGANLGKYRKMHIPDDPQFYEKFYFTPGDLGFQAFQTDYGKLGTLVCWDQWYPEAARLTALRGAEILFYPTAIGWHPSEKEEYGKAQHESWELIQRSHAVANGCYVVSVNRIGHEAGPDGGIEFWGQSFVAAPNGEILVKGSPDREEVLIVEIDRDMSDFSRTHWPFLRDRRIDAYHEITRRFIDE
ncbi:MAG TPA: carbon-nitrogen hydrolase [Planctomycetaceae bacterium]|nr:carbon-nitrogen hydrolase [Planctomycetaceae bacterium]